MPEHIFDYFLRPTNVVAPSGVCQPLSSEISFAWLITVFLSITFALWQFTLSTDTATSARHTITNTAIKIL